MALDARGKISAAQLALYIPIFFVTLFLVLRHGFRREAGWVFLFTLSIIRIVGGILLVAAELVKKPSINLSVAAFVLESVGISPLLLSTVGFLGVVGQHSISRLPLAPPLIFRILRLTLIVGLALGIAGGTDASSSSSSTVKTGGTLRKAGSIIYAASFVAIVAVHALFWSRKAQILRHRRTLLIGISAALPFIAVRIVYSVLSSFSPNSLAPGSASTTQSNKLSKFNSVTGEWQIYLIMSLIMELIVVFIYCTVGTMIPLQEEEGALSEPKPERNQMYPMGSNGYSAARYS